MMKSADLRQKYLDFFTDKIRKHKKIDSFSLILENDSTTLFTSSGMQPLVRYLLGEKHSMGKKLVDSQKCFRAEDIEEVGDNRHTTMFEMLGNWSLGDYFKKEQLEWFFDFLIKEVKLDPARLYVTIFAGDKKTNTPRDTESELIWKTQFAQIQKDFQDKGIIDRENPLITVNVNPENGMNKTDRIFYYGVNKNWWSRSGIPENMPVGEPGGPDSEVFFDFDPGGKRKIHENSVFNNTPCHPNCDCGRFLEIGNSVFMEFVKGKNGFKPLPTKNVDFGGGLERILAAANDEPDIFKTDLFWPIIKEIEKEYKVDYKGNEAAMRVVTDHIKAAVFMISEGLEPSNKMQGYVLRRLLRSAAVKMNQLKGGLTPGFDDIAYTVLEIYRDTAYFQDGVALRTKIADILSGEMEKFAVSLDRGLKEFNKADDDQLNDLFAFNLFQTYGFPFEVTAELFMQKGKKLEKKNFDKIFEDHRKLSRTASAGMFKGGLADHSEIITKLHTATHLLHTALRKILGEDIKQAGSNITSERLRFDFTYPSKITKEELNKVEVLVNEGIANNLPVKSAIMGKEEAIKTGASALFGQKYPEKVKVYTIGKSDKPGEYFSKELCGGPHVDFTGKLGTFIIKKEEAVGSGKRRIYAVLEDKKLT